MDVHRCKYLLSSFNSYVAPVCGLCCRQAVVFFQYLVDHRGLIYWLQEESRPLLTIALQSATFYYWDTLPADLNKYSKILNSWTGSIQNFEYSHSTSVNISCPTTTETIITDNVVAAAICDFFVCSVHYIASVLHCHCRRHIKPNTHAV